MVGADVKNYIRAYYRDTAVLGRRATVLRLVGSGTTMGPRGTTALDERYYRGGRGCKKLHPPLLPHRSGTRPGCRGTTTPKGRYYRDTPRYYRLYLRYYRKYSSSCQFSTQPRSRWVAPKCKERRDKCTCDSTLPFRRGPPLNSTALLRLNSTKEKRRTTPASTVSEGHRFVLCLMMKYLRDSRHTINPHTHCHQSPKHLGINMPLQSPVGNMP